MQPTFSLQKFLNTPGFKQVYMSEGRRVLRQFKINTSTLALPGKPMIVGSVDDPNSKRQFQLEVTVSKLK